MPPWWVKRKKTSKIEKLKKWKIKITVRTRREKMHSPYKQEQEIKRGKRNKLNQNKRLSNQINQLIKRGIF